MEETLVYTKEDCPYCSRLVGELREKGVDFREIDIESDRQALRLIKEKYSADRVPVMVDKSGVTVGYQGGPG